MKIPQTTLVFIHVRRELIEAGAPLDKVLEDVNAKVRRHGGIILADRQFLRQPISTDWGIDTYFDDYTSCHIEQPERDWGELQRRYFGNLWGLHEPYQYAQERNQYNQFCISVRDPTPYLVPGEMILAMVESVADRCSINCPCHHPGRLHLAPTRALYGVRPSLLRARGAR